MNDLPVHTLIGNENKNGGLLICGINHGYSKKDEQQDNAGIDRGGSYKSFFSDKAVNDYAFRNNIVNWFALWGYKLANEKGSEGAFERSFIQTNWLQSCSRDMKGVNTQKACIKEANSFLNTCLKLRPSLIFFFSQDLLRAFTSNELSPQIESIFGEKQGGVTCLQKDVINNGKFRRRFKLCFQSYEKLNIVSLPHASAARGVAHDYIEAFKPEMREIIDSWWEAHEGRLNNIQ